MKLCLGQIPYNQEMQYIPFSLFCIKIKKIKNTMYVCVGHSVTK